MLYPDFAFACPEYKTNEQPSFCARCIVLIALFIWQLGSFTSKHFDDTAR